MWALGVGSPTLESWIEAKANEVRKVEEET